MGDSSFLNVLDSVDSTNNYAMAKVHEGLASHGMAWFAHHQSAGKGQRGKGWKSAHGQNILMSIILKPAFIFRIKPFFLSAFTALACNNFLKEITGESFTIKWPNDLFWNDRKAGGILIENIFSGTEWNWAVIGIGINVNQAGFGPETGRAVSISEITGEKHDPLQLAKQLHESLLKQYAAATEDSMRHLMTDYNEVLYKKGETVRLKKSLAMFNTSIVKVNDSGQLITKDSIERQFNFGGVEWILEK